MADGFAMAEHRHRDPLDRRGSDRIDVDTRRPQRRRHHGLARDIATVRDLEGQRTTVGQPGGQAPPASEG